VIGQPLNTLIRAGHAAGLLRTCNIPTGSCTYQEALAIPINCIRLIDLATPLDLLLFSANQTEDFLERAARLLKDGSSKEVVSPLGKRCLREPKKIFVVS
jgi:hypothetical protein